jgi:hypothetical protein
LGVPGPISEGSNMSELGAETDVASVTATPAGRVPESGVQKGLE